VEELTVEGIKTFGQQVMQDWAQCKEEEKSQVLRKKENTASPNGKKN